MATASTPRRPFDRAETSRRVRHPLQALRGYIRAYVTLEGLAVGLLYAALWFWIGLVLDFGSFKLFGYDWIAELAEGAGEGTAWGVSLVLLLLLGSGLLALVTLKVMLRLMREFSDAALAMVLERRFPKVLGDRLITAVEMADPKLAEKYGFSQPMVDKTIADAAERVEKTPVREVFNWPRLYWQGLLALLATVVTYLVVGLVFCIAWGASPVNYFWRFNHVAGIWVERNILLQGTPWPPTVYLEFVRFPTQAGDSGFPELRVARAKEERPEVLLRAVKWGIFVPRTPESPRGVRSMRWGDLPQWLDAKLLDVPLASDWDGWIIDLDDLDPNLPGDAIPAEWDWQGKTSGEIRQALKLPEVRNTLAPETIKAVEKLLDWRTWTIDQLEQQVRGHAAVGRRMQDDLKTGDSYNKFDRILRELAELADSPRMARTLRQFDIPTEVHVDFRSKDGNFKGTPQTTKRTNTKFAFELTKLEESVLFRAWAVDYTTPRRQITLVPPPLLTRLEWDRQEPAYMHYRLLPLKELSEAKQKELGRRFALADLAAEEHFLIGQKQLIRGVRVSTTDDVTRLSVKYGALVTLAGVAEKEVRKDSVRIVPPPDKARKEPNSYAPTWVPVKLAPDRRTFTAEFRSWFRLGEGALEGLRKSKVPEGLIADLRPLQDKGFLVQSEFLDAVRETIPREELTRMQETLLKYAALFGCRGEMEKKLGIQDNVDKLTDLAEKISQSYLAAYEDTLLQYSAVHGVRDKLEFDFEFRDSDGVRGKRRIILLPEEDRPPVIESIDSLRKHLAMSFRLEGGGSSEDSKKLPGAPKSGEQRFLITPDAYLLLKGKVEDDYGLKDLSWYYELREITDVPEGAPGDGKEPQTPKGPKLDPAVARSALVLTGFYFAPGQPGHEWLVATHWGWLARLGGDPQTIGRRFSPEDRILPFKTFLTLYETPTVNDLDRQELLRRLRLQPDHRRLLHQGQKKPVLKKASQPAPRDEWLMLPLAVLLRKELSDDHAPVPGVGATLLVTRVLSDRELREQWLEHAAWTGKLDTLLTELSDLLKWSLTPEKWQLVLEGGVRGTRAALGEPSQLLALGLHTPKLPEQTLPHRLDLDDPLGTLKSMIKVLNANPMERDALLQLIQKDPAQTLLKRFDLEAEAGGFDLKEYLSKLHAIDTEEEPIQVELRLHIVATDNNVETGPSMVKSKALVFRVISQDFLLEAIAAEERDWTKQFDEVLKAMKEGQATVRPSTERKKTLENNLDTFYKETESLRERIRTTKELSRKIYSAYTRILRELEFNRLANPRDPEGGIVEKDQRICQALQRLLDPPPEELRNKDKPEAGFPYVEKAITGLYRVLELDQAIYNKAKDTPDGPEKAKLLKQLEARRPLYWKIAALTDVELTDLDAELNKVLRAMEDLPGKGKLIGELEKLERTQRVEAQKVHIEWLRKKRELEDLLKGTNTPKAKDGKSKTSQLTPPRDLLRRDLPATVEESRFAGWRRLDEVWLGSRRQVWANG